MDLVALATNLQQAKLTSEVQFAAARKALDLQTSNGKAAVELIEAAGKGLDNVVQAGDALVAQATGLGGQVDTYA
jgi:hypothetical protein